MTLPPYSSRREEELRRRIEEEERRRRQIAEELARPEQLPEPGLHPEAASEGSLVDKVTPLRRKYFVRGVGIGGLVGAVGGAAFGYAMDIYQWDQLAKSLPQEASFQYENTIIAGLLCLAFGASVGVLIGNAYGQRKARELERETAEKEVLQ